jgi:hypothetical protein
MYIFDQSQMLNLVNDFNVICGVWVLVGLVVGFALADILYDEILKYKLYHKVYKFFYQIKRNWWALRCK